MSDTIAIAAPVGTAVTNWAHANPEATAALAGALMSVLLDGLTRIKIFHERPWLVDLARWGVTAITRGVAAKLNKGGK